MHYTRIDEMKELFTYNAWAMQRTFEATRQVSADEFVRDMRNSFPSIRDTLVHTVGAEWVWLARWQGNSPTAVPNSKAGLRHDEVVGWWQQIEDERRGFLLSLQERSLDRVIEYTNFAGKPFAFPLWQMLRHQVNHSSYHRGQITTMLRQLGYEPTATDMILMYQERNSTSVQSG